METPSKFSKGLKQAPKTGKLSEMRKTLNIYAI